MLATQRHSGKPRRPWFRTLTDAVLALLAVAVVAEALFVALEHREPGALSPPAAHRAPPPGTSGNAGTR